MLQYHFVVGAKYSYIIQTFPQVCIKSYF